MLNCLESDTLDEFIGRVAGLLLVGSLALGALGLCGLIVAALLKYVFGA